MVPGRHGKLGEDGRLVTRPVGMGKESGTVYDSVVTQRLKMVANTATELTCKRRQKSVC